VGSKRVLLVDDEEDLTWSISKHLQKDKDIYELFSANNGKTALDILNQVPIDLVVSDIRMPEMSGLDLLLKIRDNFPATKVIIMTAYGSSELQHEANDRGCFKYIEKPFEIKELRDLILEGVQGKKGFAGKVSDFQLSDLIQMNCLGRLTNALSISKDDNQGVVFFNDGNITHCEVGNLTGEDAFYELISWEGGTFTIEKGRKAEQETIVKGWQGLLIEGLRRNDEDQKPEDEPDKVQEILNEFVSKKSINLVLLVGEDDKPIYSAASAEFAEKHSPEKITPAVKNLIESTIRMSLNLGMMGFNDMVVEMDGGLFGLRTLQDRDEYFIVLAKTTFNFALLRMESKRLAKILEKNLK